MIILALPLPVTRRRSKTIKRTRKKGVGCLRRGRLVGLAKTRERERREGVNEVDKIEQE